MQSVNEEHVNLSSLRDAEIFLSQFRWYHQHLLDSIDFLMSPSYPFEELSPEHIRSQVVKHWGEILSRLPLEQQQDRLFQNTLTAALENFILSKVNERVFYELCTKYKEEDLYIWNHCQSLTELNIPAEKLGIPQGFAISFPAAVVELASLDSQTCPLDKLNCLRSTLDYLQADIKCAIADLHASTQGEVLTPNITSEDMVPMLAAVMIQSKPPHLSSNLHYMEFYQVTLAPCDPLCSSLFVFQQALSHLLCVKFDNEEQTPIMKPQLGRGLSRALNMEDLSQLASYAEKLNNQTEQATPLDCQLKRIAGLIEKSTHENNSTKS